jgi:hypothetical protein
MDNGSNFYFVRSLDPFHSIPRPYPHKETIPPQEATEATIISNDAMSSITDMSASI